MTVFDKRKVIFSRHLRERLEERLKRKFSEAEMERIIRESQVLLETETHLYLYHAQYDLRFPCIKEDQTLIVKSVIVSGMWMPARD